MKRRYFALPLLPLAIIGLAACPTFGVDFCEGAACGSDSDGGALDATDEQVVPTGCDLTKEPKDSAACVDDTIGLFVSPAGSDSNPGTKEAPLKSISAAVGKTESQHSRVYVCAGSYAENVKVATGNKTAGIYGGFGCSDWSYAGGTPNVVVTSPGGYALEVNNLNTTLTVEDVELDSPDGKAPGESSIAVFVTQSTGVVLRRVTAKAGKGADGAEAVATSNYDGGTAPSGNSADGGDQGAPAQDCATACANGLHSTGGKGGNGDVGAPAINGGDGGPLLPPNPDSVHDGKGGVYLATCQNGNPGANAPNADAGAIGGQKGMLTSAGWQRADGTSGDPGSAGQGGGGGSGGLSGGASNAGGGGGGCGGCGGAAGLGGGSGGSSFAVLLFASTVTLDNCVAASGLAGNGKRGGTAQGGQTGGGKGNSAPNGCDGAPGGVGGAGAGGGGGAAGNSIALGYLGTPPTVTNSTLTKGTAGTPGGGGMGAAGNNGLPGAAGISAEQQDLKP